MICKRYVRELPLEKFMGTLRVLVHDKGICGVLWAGVLYPGSVGDV
jgi:hypothetical protein